MNRDDINEFGNRIKRLLLDGDSAVLVNIGAVEASPDCSVSAFVTVSGRVGKDDRQFTGNALDLEDAIWIARGKLRAARESHERAREKEKAA